LRPLNLTPLVFLLAGTALVAQTVQTGAIQGLVKNPAGKPVSGAIIIARSGQTERRTVTAENGTYRLPLVNVGKWDLTVTHPGLQTHTTRVQVKINDTQTANIQMASLAEATVVVVDTAKSLDVTSTNIASTVTAEAVAKVPRDLTNLNVFEGLLSQTAGVQVAQGNGEFFVRGAQSNQNVLNIDGTSANQTVSNVASGVARLGSSQTPLEFIDSVEVVTGAFGAEYGALGGVVNALTKSGSNTWEGQAFYSMNFPHSQALDKYNPDLEGRSEPPAIPDQFYRYGASVSGPIIKDKLFFFLGYQGFKDKIPPERNGTNWNNLTSSSKHATGPNVVSAKINWFINDSHQLIYSASHSKSDLDFGHQYPNGSTTMGTEDTGIISTTTIQTSNLTWNWLASSTFYLVASIGNYQNPNRTRSVGPLNDTLMGVSVTDYRYFITGPGRNAPNKPEDFAQAGFITGTNSRLSQYSTNPNRQYRVDVNWQLGNHQIKAGLLQQRTSMHSIYSGSQRYSLYSALTNGAPDEVTDLTLYQNEANDTTYKGVLESYYIKDVFEIRSGLRLDLGLRYDPFKYSGASGPFDGVTLMDYHHLGRQLQPRVGLTWDMNNDGKKKVYAHWGRFFENFSMSIAGWATTSNMLVANYAEGSGFIYHPDYQGNGPAFTLVGDPYYTLPMGYVGKPSPRAQRLELPHKDTITLGGDWAYNDQLSFGGVWTYWDMKNVVEDSWFLNADGSLALRDVLNPDGSVASLAVNSKVLWNPRPGPVTIVDGSGNTRTWNSNFPNPKNRFISLNLHGQFTGDRFYLNLNYDWAHHYGNVGGGISNSLKGLAGNEEVEDAFTQGTTKDFDFATSIASGNEETTPVHVFKGSGGYTFRFAGHKVDVSPSVTWQSGLGLSGYVNSSFRYRKDRRDRAFQGDRETPVLTNNQRCNMGYLPSSLITDLNIQDTFKIGKVTVVPNVAIMNVFNTRPVTSRVTLRDTSMFWGSPSPYVDFGKAKGYYQGRSVTAGINVRF